MFLHILLILSELVLLLEALHNVSTVSCTANWEPIITRNNDGLSSLMGTYTIASSSSTDTAGKVTLSAVGLSSAASTEIERKASKLENTANVQSQKSGSRSIVEYTENMNEISIPPGKMFRLEQGVVRCDGNEAVVYTDNVRVIERHEQGDYHSIRSLANQKLVAAENDGISPLLANRDTADEWELFRILPAPSYPERWVSLQSKTNSKFLCMDSYRQLVSNCDYDDIKKENFERICQNNNCTLRALSSGKYVSNDLVHGGVLMGNRDQADLWERFVFERANVESHENQIYQYLYSIGAKRYVSVDKDDILVAEQKQVDDRERYLVIHNADGTISLKSKANGKFVSADLNEDAQLIAESNSIQQWEKFLPVWQRHDVAPIIALRAMSNGKYVSADQDYEGVLVADRDTIQAWEEFYLSPY
ncbi:hypothetical protein Ddc_12510 [Ditylenchus destructor]|nr:hypothetical protein Ddc_12510 [Ditylenchus destructor]